jgi:hypothetical protein
LSEEHNQYQRDQENVSYMYTMPPQERGFNMGYKQAVKDAVNLLMIQHEAAKGSHNYWHVAANLIKAEFLPEEKNT